MMRPTTVRPSFMSSPTVPPIRQCAEPYLPDQTEAFPSLVPHAKGIYRSPDVRMDGRGHARGGGTAE
jgi:hypothetical protein